MAYSEEFGEHVLDMLREFPHLTLQKMFGGAVIKSDGVQVGVIIENEFYFRIQEHLREKYLEAGSKPFKYKKKQSGKEKEVTIHAWYKAPEEVMENQQVFIEWAEEAYEANCKSN